MDFTKEELQSLALLLQRVTISGQEAMSLVMLQRKISTLLSNSENQTTLPLSSVGEKGIKKEEPKTETK